MSELVRYRAMESLCRQSAVFRPLDSWKLLAEAEMWNHKAQEILASRSKRVDAAVAAKALGRDTAARDLQKSIAG
jgi:hypothetical protein